MQRTPKNVAPFAAAALATGVLIVSSVLAAPGGGWDQTAREMQSALRDVVGRTEVYNVTGAGGTVGLSQYTRYRGQPTELMVMGLVMVGAIEGNDSPVTL